MTKQELIELQNRAARADAAERYLAVINSPEATGKTRQAKTMLDNKEFASFTAEQLRMTLSQCPLDAGQNDARDNEVLASAEARDKQQRARRMLSDPKFNVFSAAQIRQHLAGMEPDAPSGTTNGTRYSATVNPNRSAMMKDFLKSAALVKANLKRKLSTV